MTPKDHSAMSPTMTAYPAPVAMPKRRIFLSYNSRDGELAARLRAALGSIPGLDLFYAPEHLRAGESWMPRLADEITKADGFVLLVGDEGVGRWQVPEWEAAYDRKQKNPDFRLVTVLKQTAAAPGLSFLHLLHWIVVEDPAGLDAVGRMVDGLAGAAGEPVELWRHTAPYRGLLSMTEADAAYFFGRDAETHAVLDVLVGEPDKIALLVGNSGVGKSSVAQAGVVAALRAERYPGRTPPPWPTAFTGSRRWMSLILQPGREPLRSLVEAVFSAWGLDPKEASTHRMQAEWLDDLRSGKLGLRTLVDATVAHFRDAERGEPPGLFLYVDQGEELYVQSTAAEAKRFSAVLAAGLPDPRIRVVMSLRADFLGTFQCDAALFPAHTLVQVPPLGGEALREVVSRPAELLGARFADSSLPNALAARAGEESAEGAGALPLLSYLLDDMWTAMRTRNDGTLRTPQTAIDLGRVLVDRADRYLELHRGSAEPLKRILTLRLATVREDGEPIRRKALRSEFTEAEWRIICELADHPYRLLVTAAPKNGEPWAEVAHEAIFRHWDQLREWIEGQREFLIWKARLEGDQRRWAALPEASRSDTLYRGHALIEAERRGTERPDDLSREDRAFIAAGTAQQGAERRSRARLRTGVTVVLAMLVVILAGLAWWGETKRRDAERQTAMAETNAAEAGRQAKRAQDSEREAQREKARAEAETARAETRTADAEREKANALEREQEAAEQRQAAEQARHEAAVEGDTARRNFDIAKSTIDRVIFDLARGLRQIEGIRISIVRNVLSKVRDAMDRLIEAAPDDPNLQRSRSVMLDEFGDTYLVAGDVGSALAAYQEGLEIRHALLGRDPDNTLWQSDLSVSLDNIGDLKLRSADVAGALAAHQEGLDIRRVLLRRDPDNTEWQHNLSVSLDRIGGLKLQSGDVAGALASYQEGLDIRHTLLRRDPDNTLWQRDLSVSLEGIGALKLRSGDVAGALAAYYDWLDIDRALLRRDPDNSLWQRDLSISVNRIGDLKLRNGDVAGALVAYQEGLDTNRALLRHDPENTQWQRDLSVSLDRTGGLKLRNGDVAGALAAYQEWLGIDRALLRRDPDNTEWQHDLSVSLDRVGGLKLESGDVAEALAAYQEQLDIDRALLRRDPDNTEWQHDLSGILGRIGDLKLERGDIAGALAAYQEGLEINRALLRRGPDNIEWQTDVVLNLYRVALCTRNHEMKRALLVEALRTLKRLEEADQLLNRIKPLPILIHAELKKI